jgi:YVTN family beta-propeller protein
VEFGILGPVEVRADGAPLSLGGPKPRALLAILLLHANEPVSRDRLIDGLWGERPPASAGHTLDDYVSRLRKAIGPDRIERRPPGYALHAAAEEIDVARFERLAAEGRAQLAAGEARAAATLRRALELWRGPALADVLYEPFASVEAARLEEQRLAVLEDRVEADLAVGRGAELVEELHALVREHPLRERLVGQLMVALYRAGRQTAALEVYRSMRRRLADELGLEPGPHLRELERAILEHAPALAPRRRALQRKRSRRRVYAVAVGVAAVAVGAAIGVVLGTGGTNSPPLALGLQDGVVGVPVGASRADRATALAGRAGAMATGADAVWVVESARGVARLDPRDGTVVDRIALGEGAGDVAAGAGAVWVSSTVGRTLRRIDPETGTVTQTVRLGVAQAGLAFADGALWVADATDAALLRLDPATGAVRDTVPLDSPPSGVAAGGGRVWVSSYEAGTVTAVDGRSGARVATVRVGEGPSALAVGPAEVWVTNNLDGTISRIAAGSGKVVATVATGSGPSAITLASGAVWVADEFSRDVVAIDPGTNAIVRRVGVGGRPVSLAAAGGRLWVGANAARDASHRGGTLTLLGFKPASIDPAVVGVNYPPPQFSGLGYDTLLTFRRAEGPGGLRIVPDLALALPTVGGAGSTYTFRVRPSIRYSDGRPLRPSDFRRALERLFAIGSPGAASYTTIVGAAACAARPAACDLARGVVANDAAGTITFRLVRPDPELPAKLALGFAAPVPPGTPLRDMGYRPFPGTGPYRIAHADARQTRFVRNPRFREWSHAAQPAGYPDAIVWRYDVPPAKQARAVDAGRADWTFQISPEDVRSIAIHKPARLHVSPALGLWFLRLDARTAPFDQTAVRRALNYAIDRRVVLRLAGGASLASPACQIVPPGLAGYRRYCPYRYDPARARSLVAASGTKGAAITLWAAPDHPQFEKDVLAYAARVLRSLGYRAELVVVSRRPAGRVHVEISTWFGGELGPSDFLSSFFACDAPYGHGWFCDPALDRLMERASQLEATDPDAAAAAWASADRRAVDLAASVPLVTPTEVEYVSGRVRNYQYHPIWGLLADQIWLSR